MELCGCELVLPSVDSVGEVGIETPGSCLECRTSCVLGLFGALEFRFAFDVRVHSGHRARTEKVKEGPALVHMGWRANSPFEAPRLRLEQPEKKGSLKAT